MKLPRFILMLGVPALLMLFSLTTPAQWDKKPHEQWSEGDAKKILNNSPWGKTQTFSSPVNMFRGPVSGRQGGSSSTTNLPPDATHVHFRVRFLSAKPIRQAITRMLELTQKQPLSEEMSTQLKTFAGGEFLEYIIITVSADSTEQGANVQQAAALLRQRGTGELKNNTFLEVKGGKRLFLHEYQTPRQDGLGARFLFLRFADGKPFITPESEEIRFYTELSDTYRLSNRFKTKDMMYEGKLEY